MKALIHGTDPKRLGCDKEGELKIGNTEIKISPGSDSITPLLFNGCSGDYRATFTDTAGNCFVLDKVAIRGGRVSPPSETAVELMELRCRADAAEAENELLNEKIRELNNIFDTNSLNFLIK
jgi:hypothetical protein